MSETTAPTGGSNVNRAKMSEAKVTETMADLTKKFGFVLHQMDFEVDKNRQDRTNGEVSQDASSSGDTDTTSTPIIPGNHQTLDGTQYAKILTNPAYIMAKPVQEMKKTDKEKDNKEDITTDRTEK